MSSDQQPAFSFDFGEGDQQVDMGGIAGAQSIAAMVEMQKKEMKQKNEEFLRELPKSVKERVGVLQVIQDDFDHIRKEFLKELMELEKKYEKRYEPLLERRSDIVNGEADITEEEKEKADAKRREMMLERESGGVEIEEEEEKEEKEEKEESVEESVKGIPGFWKEVLKKSELYEEIIQEHDLPSLDFLRDIRTEQFDDGEDKENSRGFHINFFFDKENPFFSNEKLSKTYFLDPEDGQTITSSEGTEIDWRDDKKNLTLKVTIKTQRHKGGKGTRKVRREEPRQSFYNFFKSVEEQMEAIPEEEEEEMDIDIEEADFEHGQVLRDRIIPRAVEYYTGEATLKYMDMIEFGDGYEEDEDEDDEDIDAIAQKFSSAGLHAGGRGGRGGRGRHGGHAEASPECQQQ